jgi:hypothetical protein
MHARLPAVVRSPMIEAPQSVNPSSDHHERPKLDSKSLGAKWNLQAPELQSEAPLHAPMKLNAHDHSKTNLRNPKPET